MNRNEAGLTEIRHNLRKPIVSEIATIEKCCPKLIFLTMKGGFQLLDLIITELKSHVTCHNSMPLSLHWLKLQHSDWRANLVRDFFDK